MKLFDKLKGDHDGTAKNRSKHNGEKTIRKRLPILIFPGFMSSALEVKESSVKSGIGKSMSDSQSGWVGKRVWLNVATAGFKSIYFGGALKNNEDKKERGEEYDEEMHLENQKETDCKSNWVKHLKLSEDLRSDPPGIKVRALQGLDAVNYLDPGGLVKHVSWVFHHVTKALIDVGYEEGKDLDAAPYDWRIPPSDLETRDSHFSNTMKQVETLYEQNDNTPVVLLCHSMGCKTAHYFLNFSKGKGGQEWVDKYIHTYFPVGAPHLGAPKSLRSTVVGDKMGLDAFLSEEEALICGRTFGSAPWMYPYRLPPSSPPIAYLRRNGVLHVEVLPFDCEEMVRDRKPKPLKLRLDITYNGKTLHSQYYTRNGEDFTMRVPETFTFATPPELPTDEKDGTLRISLYEPGLNLVKKYDKRGCCDCLTGWLQWGIDIFLPARCWKHCPCIAKHETVSNAVHTAAVTTATVATGLLGSATLLADSEEKKLSEVLSHKDTTEEFDVQLKFGDLRKMKSDLLAGKPKKDIVVGETSSMAVKLRAQWKPPAHEVNVNRMTSVRIALPSKEAPDLHVTSAKNKDALYEGLTGVQLLKSEFLPRYREILEEVYQPDPLGPRQLSAEGAPPVKRVKAVYGIDLPTEISAVYRRRDIAQREGRMVCLQEVDPTARIDSESFVIEDGLVLETEKTPQTVYGITEAENEVVHRSGDGTVPYYSLQQCQKWKDSCQVEIDELPQAEHREILADERFIKILLDYVTE